MDAYAIMHDEPNPEACRAGGGSAHFPSIASGPAIVDWANLMWQGGEDASLAAGKGIRWKLLIAGERTETRDLATGIAEVAPGAELLRHHHEPAEIYFIISSRGEMEIEDRWQPVGPGRAVYIPPDVRHALRCTGANIPSFAIIPGLAAAG